MIFNHFNTLRRSHKLGLRLCLKNLKGGGGGGVLYDLMLRDNIFLSLTEQKLEELDRQKYISLNSS